MRSPFQVLRPILFLTFSLQPLQAEMHPIAGPSTGKIGDMAEIKIPEGYKFYSKDDMKEWMEENHNLYSGNELGLLSNPDPQSGFDVVFIFNDVGLIKDADKEKLDADALWKQMKDGEESENEARKKKNWAEMHMTKWAETPQYNSQTQRLEWAIEFETQNHQFINYNTRILGRHGVMTLIMVPNGSNWQNVVGSLNASLNGFDFTSGNKYAEWTTGDKVAEFGLAALVVGGAGAFAAKSGLLGKLLALLAAGGKAIWVAIVAAFAAISNFFKKIFGGNREDGPSSGSK
jgi:uncharacterized membrane-anchored protein